MIEPEYNSKSVLEKLRENRRNSHTPKLRESKASKIMPSRNKSLLSMLNDLCYIFECVSLDYTGEAKSELNMLCRRLSEDGEYILDDKELMGQKINEVLDLFYKDHVKEGVSILSGLSRELWDLYIRAEAVK